MPKQLERNLLRIMAGIFVLSLASQELRAIQIAPRQQSADETKFFAQLRKVFGVFRYADLQQVFEASPQVMCSELMSGNGEWREVAFFNENRGLGGWFRASMTEIRSQLDVYTFDGTCLKETSALRVATRFPVDASLKAFRQKQIARSDIAVLVNAPVSANFEKQTRAYTFDLPYLFRVSEPNDNPLYALSARTPSDHYAPEAINRWECKAADAEDVTYQFLICRTSLLLKNGSSTDASGKASYGASAFSILTDGREASASVNLTFK